MSSARRWEIRIVPGAEPTARLLTCTWPKPFNRMFSCRKPAMVGFASTATIRPEGPTLAAAAAAKVPTFAPTST